MSFNLRALLEEMIEREASDLHITAGERPKLRVDGDITARPAVDQGLRRHMVSIYNSMTSGVLLTGIVALLTASSAFAVTLFAPPVLRLMVML